MPQKPFSIIIPCDRETAQAAIDGACWEIIDNEIGTEYKVTATEEGVSISAENEVLFNEVVETIKFELAALAE